MTPDRKVLNLQVKLFLTAKFKEIGLALAKVVGILCIIIPFIVFAVVLEGEIELAGWLVWLLFVIGCIEALCMSLILIIVVPAGLVITVKGWIRDNWEDAGWRAKDIIRLEEEDE